MGEKTHDPQRRKVIKAAGAALAASVLLPSKAPAQQARNEQLQVWSCGGLAEAFRPANKHYEQLTGTKINYTGAFAAALGKSLLGGAETEIFAGRVLKLAQKLISTGKMEYFKPLCFTRYVLATPKGNPAGIATLEDLTRSGVRVALAPEASTPGGPAVIKLLEIAKIKDEVLKNTVIKGSCVHQMISEITSSNSDVTIVENRITRLPSVKGQLDVLPIPENVQPPPPLTFTIGVMKAAHNRKLADEYLEFIVSAEGQKFFDEAGFIPALSEKGKELTEKLGVHDV
ncbi:MAG: substrate-binding domain-containing protein [Desulfobulbaceae bacterium]|nr:substrate-binding domain-containing protein [Desulfobulbaceae bacterium]